MRSTYRGALRAGYPAFLLRGGIAGPSRLGIGLVVALSRRIGRDRLFEAPQSS